MKNMIESDNGICTLHLTESEVEAMLTALQLAQSAAIALGQQSTGHNTSKMTKFAQNINELMRIITQSVKIGEPESSQIN